MARINGAFSGLKHPGTYVRETVIPPKMTVSEAAKRLGIGRPALSTFLNGRSALTAEMAVRLQKAFGADADHLLKLQSTLDRNNVETDVAVSPYSPALLAITARQIEEWATSRIQSRTRLPILIRKLVHSTVASLGDLERVEFPGFDEGERPGPDGIVKANAATAWIPQGDSIWEVSTRQNAHGKAERDYAARLKAISPEDRAVRTFVFVTARNWRNRVDWAATKESTGEWKAVRAYDANDLEQWLELSHPAQIWLAEELDLPAVGADYKTLASAWEHWAGATNPRLTSALFDPWIKQGRTTFADWVCGRSAEPLVISADSRDAAFAFLACLLDSEDLIRFKDVTAILAAPHSAAHVVASLAPRVVVSASREVEQMVATQRRETPHVIYRPPNDPHTEADILLGPVYDQAFYRALSAMSIEKSRIGRLALESGRSLSILRRRMAREPAIRQPSWEANHAMALALRPFALAGSWRVDREGDKQVLAELAAIKFECLEDDFARLASLHESPVWAVQDHRGVKSQIESLFGTARVLTPSLVDRFFTVSHQILTERDPALDLPEQDRWLAIAHGKARKHSDALRSGVCDALVLLAVHGKHLSCDGVGLDLTARADQLVRKLLTPLRLDSVLSLGDCLPLLAEAAPRAFLDALEADLRADTAVLFRLLKLVKSNELFQSPPYSPVLYALECLAWLPPFMPRVCQILAKLSPDKANDMNVESPNHSLLAILNHRWPQTAATLDERAAILNLLAGEYPSVARHACLMQLECPSRTENASMRPRWRGENTPDAIGVSDDECIQFARRATEILLKWSRQDQSTLGDLVEHLAPMQPEERTQVWELIDRWAETASEDAVAVLRERIRRAALTRRGPLRAVGEPTIASARRAYEALRPSDPVVRHRWLFETTWLQASVEADETAAFDNDENFERLEKLRRSALEQIGAMAGVQGIVKLLMASGSPHTVGRCSTLYLTHLSAQVEFAHCCLSLGDDGRAKANAGLQAFLAQVSGTTLARLLREAAESLTRHEQARLFSCAPFRGSIWHVVDSYGGDVRSLYWQGVTPDQLRHTASEFSELIDRFLEARRPEVAFHCVRPWFRDIETSRLRRLLLELALVDRELAEDFRPERHAIAQAMSSLADRHGVSADEMAQLELQYLGALIGNEDIHGIPNLENRIAQSPTMFVEFVMQCSNPSDRINDPPESAIADPAKRDALWLRSYRVLDHFSRIPGLRTSGEVDPEELTSWIARVRRLARQHARQEAADGFLGRLLAKAPASTSGVWPCDAVCQAIDAFASHALRKGFVTGALNARRRPEWRGEGGRPEHRLAAKCAAWAKARRYVYPTVGTLLQEIAESYRHHGEWWDDERKLDDRRLLRG